MDNEGLIAAAQDVAGGLKQLIVERQHEARRLAASPASDGGQLARHRLEIQRLQELHDVLWSALDVPEPEPEHLFRLFTPVNGNEPPGAEPLGEVSSEETMLRPRDPKPS